MPTSLCVEQDLRERCLASTEIGYVTKMIAIGYITKMPVIGYITKMPATDTAGCQIAMKGFIVQGKSIITEAISHI